MEELCKITFEDTTHKAVITITGENDTISKAHIKFTHNEENGQRQMPDILAQEFMKYLMGY